MTDFVTKDSGKREEYESGMRRDVQEGKARPDLIPAEILNLFHLYIDCPVTRASDLSSINESIIAWVNEPRYQKDSYELLTKLIVLEVQRISTGDWNQAIFKLELRLAGLYGRGASKYGEGNWQKATGNAEYKRFIQSAWRHWLQYVSGDVEEDHFSAVLFNIYGAKYVLIKKEECPI
jgi:hypothetical protein